MKPLKDRWQIARLLPLAGAGVVATSLLVNLVLGALPVAFAIATSQVLGRVPAAVRGGTNSAAWDSLVAVFVVAAAVFVGQQILAPLSTSLGELVARRIDGHMYRDLMSASLRSPGVAPLEDQQVLADLRVAATELEFGVQSPGQAGAGLLAITARHVQLIGYTVLVGAMFSWLAAAGLLAAVLLFRHVQRAGQRGYGRERGAMGSMERKIGYLRDLAIGSPAAKEIRVFGLVGWLKDALDAATLNFLRPLWTIRRRAYLWPFVWAGAGLLVASIVVVAALGAAGPGRVTLTEFVLVAQAVLGAIRLAEYYPEADLQTTIGLEAYHAVRRFADRIDQYPGVEAKPQAGEPARRAPDPTHAIRFDNVTFRYPGQTRPVFDGLDLTIPAGRCTAIVGVNGAGKTTLIKLLARLYEPTEGAVRVDGVDVREYSLDAWRAKLAVIFQDYVRYEVSAADNIGYGAVDELGDRAGIRAAAEAVGIAPDLDRLPHGLDTPLARHLVGGADLSGGQWQRVALARALFALRHGSSVMVLDEPTASLDVRAEAAFFDEFAGLTQGATTVLISHRFSTVRHADLIVVLERGRVLEQGTHDELIALGGRYARLFRLQAARLTGGEPATPAALAEMRVAEEVLT
jgi:ATP-binding cassette, subfamily B, bacterial